MGKILTNAIFEKGDCLSIGLGNNKYGAALVLTEEKNSPQGLNLLLVIDYYKDIQPQEEDFKKANCFLRMSFNTGEMVPYLIYCNSIEYRRNKYEFIKIGNIKVKKKYETSGGPYANGQWDSIVNQLNQFYENEQTSLEKIIKVLEMI